MSGGLPEGLTEALRRCAASAPVLIGLDFDGVLAPVVAVPSAARMPTATREALQALVAGAGRCHVALVSGRALADLAAVADPPPGVTLVGSHGAEVAGAPIGLSGIEEELLSEIVEAVQAVVDTHPGTMREDKPAGVVLHTRNADRAAAAAATAAVLNGPARLAGIRTTTGKEVVELSVLDVDKGLALHRLRIELGVGAALYVGDDVTDEHAFAVLDDDEGDVTIKVGDGPTGARWRISGPETVPELLAAVAQAVARST